MTGIQIHKDSQPRTDPFLSILFLILISPYLLQNSFIYLSKHSDHQRCLDSINQILFRYKFIGMIQKHLYVLNYFNLLLIKFIQKVP